MALHTMHKKVKASLSMLKSMYLYEVLCYLSFSFNTMNLDSKYNFNLLEPFHHLDNIFKYLLVEKLKIIKAWRTFTKDL